MLLAPAALAAQGGSVLGEWSDPTGSIVRIDHCGAEICLWVIAVSPSISASTDVQNPDPGERGRALCGLKIGSGFTQRDAGHAAGGSLYDPKTGKTYHGMMWIDGANLELRGYVGISLFGRSETWTRPAKPIEGCKTAP
jgi:uncharacterized protein (DUF2147 family)